MRFPFTLPTKVSRFYPLFALILLVNNGVLFYAWQNAEIRIEGYAHFDEKEKQLRAQIESLQTAQLQDRATLALQEQKVTEATNRLQQLEADIANKEQALATREEQLAQAQGQLNQQKGQLSQNASELDKLRNRPPLFSFQNESSLDSVEQKIADIKELVTSSYDYMREVYGEPYLLNQIVITFVNDLSIENSAGEIVIESGPKGVTIRIKLKDFDKNDFQDVNTVIHEILHGFHGTAVFNSSALEEGITVAATEAVMQRMIEDGKLPRFSHLYLTLTDQQYTLWNANMHVPASNEGLYAHPEVSKLYQLLGEAWYRLYQEDKDVFKKINANYYPKVQQGNRPDNAMVLNAIRASVKSVRGQSIDTYLSANRAFNPN